MMRLAFDYQTFTQQTYGGISRYFSRLIEGLHGLGDQVKVFAPLHINSYIEYLPPQLVCGHRINQYPFRTTRLFNAYNHLVCSHQMKYWQPQIVHETYYAKSRSAAVKCPVVITVYDMIHELFQNEFSKRVDTIGAKRISILRADHVICISENTKNDLMALHGTPENKITVIHLGCDIPTKTDLQAIAHIKKENKPYLLYVGVRGGYKNFGQFIQAVATSSRLFSDFRVIAFGGGAFTPEEDTMINSFGFPEGQVEQIGGNDDVLNAYYAAAAAFIYPSRYEGFGIPPLEAMAQNCPVICSDSSSIPEIVGNAAEYFSPLHVDSIRSAIEKVVYSNCRSDELKVSGAARIKDFTWEKCIQKTQSVYQSLIQFK